MTECNDFTFLNKKVRAIRRRVKHWNQCQLAYACGMQTGSISKIETGHHCPQDSTIAKIAKALDVEFDDLVEWKFNLDGEES